MRTPKECIALIKEYNFAIQKKFGQNFLIDSNIIEGIIEAADITKDDCVLEIGPGMGAMTGYLLESARKVIAVEVDRMLIPILQDTLNGYDNLVLINDDILKVDIASLIESENDGRPIKVVANLPYYITTPIIMELLEREEKITSITVMVHKEVAQRMQEGPGSKSYGALSLAVQYYAKAGIVLNVSKNCFLPKPDVDSAVIKLDIYEPCDRPVKARNTEQMFALIRAAFNQRRKTLLNSLGNAQELNYTKEQIAGALARMGKSETIRGEALSLPEFAELSDILSQQ